MFDGLYDIDKVTMVIQGKKWTDWKLVEGRSNQKYTDEAAVAQTVKEAGFEPYEQKLLGITAMTALLGKTKFDELLGNKYAESPDFAILLFAYAVDGGEVKVIDLANGEQIPKEILDALTDDSVIKWAFNANFERVCLSRYLSDLGILLDPFHDKHPLFTECARFLNPIGWRCTMVWSAYMGLPLSLASVGSVLGLEEQKMTEGKALIRYFSTPPFHEPKGDRWELFKSYSFEISRVLVIAPLRVARYTWPQEIAKREHLKGIRYSVAVGTEKERLAALQEPASIYIINRENVAWLVEKTDFTYDTIVIDELSSFKNWGNKRFKALMKVRPLATRAIGLTGTPSGNGLMDLFAEFKVLDMGKRLGRFIGQYRRQYFVPDKRSQQMVFSYKPIPGAEQEIYDRISDITISMKATDFLDPLPDTG